MKTEQEEEKDPRKTQKWTSQEAVKGLANELFNFFSNNVSNKSQKKKNFNITKGTKIDQTKSNKPYNKDKSLKS